MTAHQEQSNTVDPNGFLNVLTSAERTMIVHLASAALPLSSFSDAQQKSIEKASSFPIFKMVPFLPSTSCQRVEAVAKSTLSNIRNFERQMKLENNLQFLRFKSNEVERAINSLESATEMHLEYASTLKYPLRDDGTVDGDSDVKNCIDPEVFEKSTLSRIFKLLEQVKEKRERVKEARKLYDTLKFMPHDITDLQELIIEKRKRLEFLKTQ